MPGIELGHGRRTQMTQTNKIEQDINDPNLNVLIDFVFKLLILMEIKNGTASAVEKMNNTIT